MALGLSGTVYAAGVHSSGYFGVATPTLNTWTAVATNATDIALGEDQRYPCICRESSGLHPVQ